MGGACRTFRTEESYVQCFGRKPSGETDHLEDLGEDWRIILNGVLKKQHKDVNCIDLPQDYNNYKKLFV
jgi:hypothetical protein